MELPLKGGCMCGAVRYEITCEPTRVYACHCTDCQRATTSAFSIGTPQGIQYALDNAVPLFADALS